ncbi:MAG: MFS transporter [Chloroflexi bacterium]|nr:MFS transporter [Chloroflexota bacterium]
MKSTYQLPLTNPQSWQLLTLLFALANFLEVAVVAHFVLFTPEFLRVIGFAPDAINAWTGPMSALAFVIGIWFVPFWGVLADRHGRKPLILRSHYIEVVAMALAAFSGNVWLYVIARSLTGFALGNTGLMYASLTEVAPKNRVALALGLVNGSAPLGSLVGGLFGGIIVARLGVHWLFGLDAIIAAITALILTAFYRETFTPKPTTPIATMLGDALRAVIHSPVAVTIFVANFFTSAATFLAFPYLPVRVGDLVGALNAPLTIGIIQGVAGIATLAGSMVGGGLANRVGVRRLLIALMTLAPLLWLPMFFARDVTELTIAWAILSAINPSISSLMFTIVSLNIPAEKRGAVLSMIYLPLNLAFIIGPSSAAIIASAFGVPPVFLASAAMALIATGIFVGNWTRTSAEERG